LVALLLGRTLEADPGREVEMPLHGESVGRDQQLFVLLEPEVGVDDDERERLARQLGAELNELDIESLTAVGGIS